MGFLQTLFQKPDLDAMALEARTAMTSEKEVSSESSDIFEDFENIEKEEDVEAVVIRDYDRKLKDDCERLYQELLPTIQKKYEEAIEEGMDNFILEKRYFMGANSMKLIAEMVIEDQYGKYVQVEKAGMTVWINYSNKKRGVNVIYDEGTWTGKLSNAKKITGKVRKNEGFNRETLFSTIRVKTPDGEKVVLEGFSIPLCECGIIYDFYCRKENGRNIVVSFRMKEPQTKKQKLKYQYLGPAFFEWKDDTGFFLCNYPELWNECENEKFTFLPDMELDSSEEFTNFYPQHYLQGAMGEDMIASKLNYWQIIDDGKFCQSCLTLLYSNVKKARDISVYDMIDRKDYGKYLEKFGEDFNRYDYLQTKVLHIIDSMQEKTGHLWIDMNTLFTTVRDKLKKEADERVVMVVMNRLMMDERIINDDSRIYLRDVYLNYQRVRRRFYTGRADVELRVDMGEISRVLDQYEKELKISLNEDQRRAIAGGINSQTSIITGGPGTGKTFVVKAIYNVLRRTKPNANIMFAAPTGKAAANMASIVRAEGSTLHSILKLNPDTGAYEAENFSVAPDVLIVDETSMCDVFLLGALATKAGKKTKIIFVGDPNQLQSVERGDMFTDMIESGYIPVYRLEKTYRQGGNAVLLDNARAIMRGNPNEMVFDNDQCTFVECTHDEMMDQISHWYYKLASEYVPIQVKVLSPYNGAKTSYGTEAAPINKMLSAKLSKGRRRVSSKFRDGEIIMATKNTDKYKNGQTGRIFATDEGVVRLRFKNKEVFVEKEQLSDFEHGYATTVNRSQGEEFKGIIIVLDEAYIPESFYKDKDKKHFFTRDRLYTAFTRGKEKVVLIGSRKVLDYVIKNEPMKRNTGY